MKNINIPAHIAIWSVLLICNIIDFILMTGYLLFTDKTVRDYENWMIRKYEC